MSDLSVSEVNYVRVEPHEEQPIGVTTAITMVRCPVCHEWFEAQNFGAVIYDDNGPIAWMAKDGAPMEPICDDCSALLSEVQDETDGTR